jgi:hypothetical protein
MHSDNGKPSIKACTEKLEIGKIPSFAFDPFRLHYADPTSTANEHIARLAYSARRVASFASYARALFGQNEIVAGSRETRRSWAKIAECHKDKRK